MAQLADSRTRLDIGMLAPLVSPIREPFLGGAQALVRDLAVGLAQRGEQVTLYAASDSDPAVLPGVKLVAIDVDAQRALPTDFASLQPDDAPSAENPAIAEAFARAFAVIEARNQPHDLLHSHGYDAPAFRGAQRLRYPVAHTLHLPALDPAINTLLSELAPAGAKRGTGQPWLATVSNACAATYTCRIDAVIYNGINVGAIPFGRYTADKSYLLFAGRITPEKGVRDAILIALATGKRLKLVGGVYDARYYAEQIQPLLLAHPGQIEELGAQPRVAVWRLMAGADAVLMPSFWDEPFGIVAAEAQAAGAPVVGYASGGIREVIAEGETGYLVPRGEVEQAAAAVSRAALLDRHACRLRAETLFSMERTLDGYQALYTRMLAAQ